MQGSMISKIGRGLNHVEEYVLFLMVLQMGISVFIQVIMRYLFQSAITWLDELVHIEVIFLTFFGASLCIKYGAHISVDALKKGIQREPYRSLMEVLNHLVMAVYVSVLVTFGMNLISAMATNTNYTPTLRIPKHYLYFVVCVALALIGIRSILGVYRILATTRSRRVEEVKR
jgi:TRAP-type C4-dicarboxylate transport system permease small subunit